MKKRQPDNDKSSKAVNMSWNLVHNHRREDPEAHINEALKGDPRASYQGVPPLIRGEMAAFQTEVVASLGDAMGSWFHFYFVLGDGSPHERLGHAAAGLEKASDRLSSIARQIARLPSRGTGWSGIVMSYSDAAECWAAASEILADGARYDRGAAIEQSFERLDRGSALVEPFIDTEAKAERALQTEQVLSALEDLRPTKRVPRKAIEAAKSPWRRAIRAAGSKLSW